MFTTGLLHTAYKAAFTIKDQLVPKTWNRTDSMQDQNWYMEERMLLLALTDVDVEEEEKMKMRSRLVEFDVPELCGVGNLSLLL